MSGCFCSLMAWANINNEGIFVELISGVGATPHDFGLSAGGGMGYKYNSPNENYFGYFQGSLNLNILALGVPRISTDEIGDITGVFNFEYGYEFKREDSFSYGVSVSPIVPIMPLGEGDWNILFYSLIGVFGNIKINDSFLISFEGKGIISVGDYFIQEVLKTHKYKGIISIFHPLTPIPFVGVKGQYFFLKNKFLFSWKKHGS